MRRTLEEQLKRKQANLEKITQRILNLQEKEKKVLQELKTLENKCKLDVLREYEVTISELKELLLKNKGSEENATPKDLGQEKG